MKWRKVLVPLKLTHHKQQLSNNLGNELTEIPIFVLIDKSRQMTMYSNVIN